LGKLNFLEDDFRYLQNYDTQTLANMVGYEDYHAIGKGMITASDKDYILLLVTKEKRSHVTQYIDELVNNCLYIQGQEKHGTDKRIDDNLSKNHDKFYLFYRDRFDLPYTYYGRVFLIGSKMNKDEPSRFEFILSVKEVIEIEDEMELVDYILAFPNESGENISFLIEGAKKITQHVRYERNPFNRKEAIRIQGYKCRICGFGFDEVYGKDLADNYIEVHHIKQLSDGEQVIDPAIDLLPVCANCHRMLHRKKKSSVTIAELKRIVEYNRLINKS